MFNPQLPVHPQVAEFSKLFTETKIKHYVERNQTDQRKIYDDCYYSKLAEFAVYKYLRQLQNKNGEHLWTPVEYPGIEVLQRPNWDADLRNSRYKFAVKSVKQGMVDRFGLSWTFNLKPRDKILDISDVNYLVVFVITKTEYDFEIYGCSHTQALKDSCAYMFMDGLDLPRFKDIKLFVHADHVKTGVMRVIRTPVTLRKERIPA